MDLNELNKTELIEILRLQTGRRVSRTLATNDIINMLDTGSISTFSKTEKTRYRLEQFIEKNWDYYQTNLPCRGEPNEGKCTVYRCPEGRHVDCYLNVKDEIDKEDGK